MAVKCILFDGDGVTINTEMFSIQYQKKTGVSNDKMLPFFEGVFQDCIIGKSDLKEEVEPYLKGWMWDRTVDEFLKLWFKSEDKPDKRILDAVRVLREKGIICCLVTNQEKYRTEYIIDEMRFGEIFDYVFSSADIGYKKPSKEFYQYVIDKLCVSSEEVMYFDDMQECVDEAKKIGIKAYLYSGFSGFKQIIDVSCN